MPETRKSRFPFIELLSIAIVVVASVIALYPGADNYVVGLVKGTTPMESAPVDPNIDQQTQEIPTHLASSTTETQSLEQRTDNSFEAPVPPSVPALNTSILPEDEQVLDFVEEENTTKDNEDQFVATLNAPEHSLENAFVDDRLEFDDTIHELPQDLPEEQLVDAAIELTAPLTEHEFVPEAEFTTEFEAAPRNIPTSQISLELPTDYDADEDIIPVDSEDSAPEIRQLPIWEPDSMRVIEGSLTPAVSPLQKLPQTSQQQAAAKTELETTIDDEPVAWQSAIVKNKMFHENDLKPAVKQIAAPKIRTARLPELPSTELSSSAEFPAVTLQRVPQAVPQPFARGFIPEHTPGEKAPMMSQRMQIDNDFELPARPAAKPTATKEAAPLQLPVQNSTNPLR